MKLNTDKPMAKTKINSTLLSSKFFGTIGHTEVSMKNLITGSPA